jgi:hypothetical protein
MKGSLAIALDIVALCAVAAILHEDGAPIATVAMVVISLPLVVIGAVRFVDYCMRGENKK